MRYYNTSMSVARISLHSIFSRDTYNESSPSKTVKSQKTVKYKETKLLHI